MWKWNDVFRKQPSIKTQLHIVSERQHNCSLYLETQKACREFYHEKSSQASIVKNLARPLYHRLKCKSTIQNPWEGDWVRFTEQRGKMSSLRLVLQQCYWLQMARNKTQEQTTLPTPTCERNSFLIIHSHTKVQTSIHLSTTVILFLHRGLKYFLNKSLDLSTGFWRNRSLQHMCHKVKTTYFQSFNKNPSSFQFMKKKNDL